MDHLRYAANMQLARAEAKDFFSNDVHDYNPFLHLWSLGVEEQCLVESLGMRNKQLNHP